MNFLKSKKKVILILLIIAVIALIFGKDTAQAFKIGL